jgi:hypothetical protein
VVAPPTALAEDVAPTPASKGWLLGLALVVAATVAALLANL